jgi:hypothetical protein
MNNQINDMISNICKYFNRIDLLMFSHTNKRFRTYLKQYLLKNVGKNRALCKITTFERIKLDKNIILCASAAFEGYLDILIYLRENNCDWDWDTCAHASSRGHLHILKWARGNGCNWNVWTLIYAAQNGHLNILKWAIENNCFWHSYICSLQAAAYGGQLEVLKWAQENRLQWDINNCLRYAKEKNHKEIMEWIGSLMNNN